MCAIEKSNGSVQEKPSKPLKVLILDGGGLQAIATLVVLDELLDTIKEDNKAKKPRPCDIFDIIAGIGAGGWLAILLGRFRLDITACLTEWFNLTRSVFSTSKRKSYSRRIFQHAYFDNEVLKKHVDRLTKLYGTGRYMYPEQGERDVVRCKYVFVAALRADSMRNLAGRKRSASPADGGGRGDYSLFRSYPPPEGANPHQGPKRPEELEISEAFCATGAAKYFFAPWKAEMADNGAVSFLDKIFPAPHNITELALDEMSDLFGPNFPICVLLNVGPGRPDHTDLNRLSRKFSWGLTGSSRSSLKSGKSKTSTLPSSTDKSQTAPNAQPHPERANDETGEGWRLMSSAKGDGSESLNVKTQSLNRHETFRFSRGLSLEKSLKRTESGIERDIRARLSRTHPVPDDIYFRLAPSHSLPGAPFNDTHQSDSVVKHTRSQLSQEPVKLKIKQAREALVT